MACSLVLPLLLAVAAHAAPAAPAHAATATADLARDTLAWVGARVVTAEDLARRVELMPWQDPEHPGVSDTANVRALEALVAEKLLAQEAERQGGGAGGRVTGMRRALARALARDALYRHEVGGDSTRADAVLARVLVGRRVSVDPATFQLLCDSLRTRMAATPESRAGKNGRIRILTDDVDFLAERMSASLGRTLVEIPGAPLTLEDVIEDLRFYEFSVRSLDSRGFALDFNAHLKVVVERDLLAAEAQREHLDRLPDVKREIETWTDAWRANLLVGTTAAALRRDADVDGLRWLALHVPDRARDWCEVDLEEVLSASEEEAAAVRDELRRGATGFAALARERSTRKEWAARGGRSGYFAVRAQEQLGYAALLSPIDSLVGPVKLREGYSVFRVLGKRVAADSSSVRVRRLVESARGAALAEARAHRVDAYVAALAGHTHVRLDLARTQALALSTQKMITRRVLGFGGEMMAAPGLVPMWGWAPLWRTAGTALP